MNKKVVILISILLILILGGVGFFMWKESQDKTVSEYQPEEEITEEQLRQTIVTLYYPNKETGELMPEGRLVDVKTLLTDPYQTLINLLIQAPKNEKLESAIPAGTKVNKTELNGDMVYLDLSKEFVENHPGGIEAEKKTIYSIVNTLTELTEVNSVKILIDGKEKLSFKDKKMEFKEAFVRLENSKK